MKTMDEQSHCHPTSRPHMSDFYNRQGRYFHSTEYYGNRTTSEGERKTKTFGTAYDNSALASTGQQLFNTSGCDGRPYSGYKRYPVNDLDIEKCTTYPWFYGASETDASRHFCNRTGSSYQALFDVNNINSHSNGLYKRPTSTLVNNTDHCIDQTLAKNTVNHSDVTAWTESTHNLRNETADKQYISKTKWMNNQTGERIENTTKEHKYIYCDNGPCNISLRGLASLSDRNYSGACYQLQSQNETSWTTDGASRKRKFSCDNETTSSSDKVTRTSNVDKRALYSKFRVVKKTDPPPKCTEIPKSKPVLRRVKLDDKTIVDVNNVDGLPHYTKRSNIVPTLSPTKQNEADAAIGNIKFITLENMKVVRRNLELVLALQQDQERQDRLKLEAKVVAKVKVNAKERSRKDKRRRDRKCQVKIGL